MTMRAITADIVPWPTRSLRVRQRVAGVSNDDVGSSAGNYSLDLRLLGLGRSELVKCLLQIVEKGFPLCRRYHEMLVRRLHGAPCVLLWSAGGPADHFRNEILEACWWNAMMSLVYLRICTMLYTPPSRLR